VEITPELEVPSAVYTKVWLPTTPRNLRLEAKLATELSADEVTEPDSVAVATLTRITMPEADTALPETSRTVIAGAVVKNSLFSKP
jgi:hypothetical protein